MIKYLVYTDGSYSRDEGICHGGVVFCKPDGTIANRIHVKADNPYLNDLWNVGGELLAAYCAFFSIVSDILKNHDESESYMIEIVYDYEGVGKWLTGEWRTKKTATAWYKKAIEDLRSKVPNLLVQYTWVKGHGDDSLNKEADRMASYDMGYAETNGFSIIDLTSFLKGQL